MKLKITLHPRNGFKTEVRIYWNPEFQEFVVIPFDNKTGAKSPEDFWYFTGDQSDAENTAKVIAEAPFKI